MIRAIRRSTFVSGYRVLSWVTQLDADGSADPEVVSNLDWHTRPIGLDQAECRSQASSDSRISARDRRAPTRAARRPTTREDARTPSVRLHRYRYPKVPKPRREPLVSHVSSTNTPSRIEIKGSAVVPMRSSWATIPRSSPWCASPPTGEACRMPQRRQSCRSATPQGPSPDRSPVRAIARVGVFSWTISREGCRTHRRDRRFRAR
jgi:hypothetical protein